MSSQKSALITGITGQDGAILAGLLLEKGYEVHGLRPYSAVPDTVRIDHLDNLKLHYGDMTDGGNLTRLIETVKPDEIYNLAAQSLCMSALMCRKVRPILMLWGGRQKPFWIRVCRRPINDI